jgi:SAM-dependent methyltransferase
MHDTALLAGKLFAEKYGGQNKTVVDIGGKNVNGSLRSFFENLNMKYICVDIEPDYSVDIVIKPTDKLPFENNSIDLVVSTSCFEHDPCFWITFKELTRIIKKDGFIYVNAPSNGFYHTYPGDNWRFYSDAAQALAYWSGYKYGNEDIYPVKVIETFHILPLNDIWVDFVGIWQRVEEDKKETEIVVKETVYNNIGILQKALNDNNCRTSIKFIGTQK